MLDTSKPPFKRTCFVSAISEPELPWCPLQIEAEVENCTGDFLTTYTGVIKIPRWSRIDSVDLQFISFLMSKENGKYATHLFLQRLDAVGRPSGPPFPLGTASEAVPFMKLNVPLHAGLQARLFLVHESRDTEIQKVRLNVRAVASRDAFLVSPRKLTKMLDWASSCLKFECTSPNTNRKRPRTSPTRSPRTQPSSNDDTPPRLIYAQVAGGDDES